jgi:predicted permease
MPRDFAFPGPDVAVYASSSLLGEDDVGAGRVARWLDVVARLRPGVTAEQGRAQAEALLARLAATYPETNGGWTTAAVEDVRDSIVGPVRRGLVVLFGAVVLVLLVVCANVANLLLVRAAGRRREIAVRLAIGAGRGRLVRQLLTESVVLSGLGGAAGVLVAWWGVRLLAALDPARARGVRALGGLGAVSFDTIRLDTTALAYAAGLALATGILFGLAPALQATRVSLTGGLKDAGIGSAGRRAHGASGRSLLAVVEVALALVLLAGSGLMLRSLGKLLAVRPGFNAEQVLTMRFGTREGATGDSLPRYYDRVLERVAALPGVTGVALQDCPPLNGGCNGTVIVLRDRPPAAPGTEPPVGVHWVTPNWPTVLQVPLRSGRLFDGGDRVGTRKVVLVSETAARTFWPGEDALGRPVSVGQGGFSEDTAYVVGVVGDVRYGSLDSLPKPDVYLSYYQSPSGRMMLFARTAGDPLALAAAARRAIHEIAPEAPVFEVRTLEERVADTMGFARFSTTLLALFAAMALALATMGTYGVISFAVAQRTREIAVRSALGATRGGIVRLVVRQGVTIAAVGGAVGTAAALGATRVLGSLLYDVEPTDPATFAAIVVVLVAAVVAASWAPARRAAGLSPMDALRSD